MSFFRRQLRRRQRQQNTDVAATFLISRVRSSYDARSRNAVILGDDATAVAARVSTNLAVKRKRKKDETGEHDERRERKQHTRGHFNCAVR